MRHDQSVRTGRNIKLAAALGLALSLSCFAQPTHHSVGLTWLASPSTQTTGYNIYRCGTPPCVPATNPTSFTLITSTPINALTYTDDAVQIGVWNYAATAVGPGQESALSTSPPALTVGPVAVTLSATGSTTLTWIDSNRQQPLLYNVLAASGTCGTAGQTFVLLTPTPISAKTFAAKSGTFCYEVAAVYVSSTPAIVGDLSNLITVTTPILPPTGLNGTLQIAGSFTLSDGTVLAVKTTQPIVIQVGQ